MKAYERAEVERLRQEITVAKRNSQDPERFQQRLKTLYAKPRRTQKVPRITTP